MCHQLYEAAAEQDGEEYSFSRILRDAVLVRFAVVCIGRREQEILCSG